MYYALTLNHLGQNFQKFLTVVGVTEEDVITYFHTPLPPHPQEQLSAQRLPAKTYNVCHS